MSVVLQLDQSLVSAIAESSTQVFSKIFNMKFECGKWTESEDKELHGDYSGMIPITQSYHVEGYTVNAMMCIIFNNDVIVQLLSNIYDENDDLHNEELICDGISEITNMIYMGVKTILNASQSEYSIQVSHPIVKKGTNHIVPIHSYNRYHGIKIPFKCDDDSFIISITLNDLGK